MSGVVVWFTGLPASGKSTLAGRVRDLVGRPVAMLDSDQLRTAIGATSYASEDRDAFYAALATTAGELAWNGQIVLVAATAPKRAYREAARRAAPAFVEVFVRADLAQCEARDTKGNYARARAGLAPTLPGVGVPYEAPQTPDVVADGGTDVAAAAAIVAAIERVTREAPAASS
jgi:adenylylsulfate kinase